MYVQKKLMAKSKLEQEKFADIANLHKQQLQQQQIDAMKTFASLQQMNSSQQQQITAILAAAMMNKNFIFNQQSPQSQITLTTSQEKITPIKKNQPKSNFSDTSQVNSRKRSHSDIDAFSSSEEEHYSFAKLRQPPSLGKINTKPVGRNLVKVDQNNNANSYKNTNQSSVNSESIKQYDSLSNHSDEEEPDGKKQNKQCRNQRKMLIEKKRRDRINNSLNELRRLVPAAFEKQGSTKLEKAEILQMTVDHLKQLHAKGFDTFSFEPSKFALDCHTIGFRECANEVERYLNNFEKIDEPVKQRVISHLQFYSNEREQILLKEAGQLPSKLNLTNLKNFENEKLKSFTTSLPPSPPSSSVSPSALSTSSNTSQISNISSLDNITNINNIQTNKSQIYPPFALLKSKKLNYNNLTTNNLNTNNYDKTLKIKEEKKNSESNDSKICRPWGQATLNAY